ncbi:MAG: hypothetical protein HUU09_10915 [Candidatus Jettenia caeni]|nr:hypothetical protein [Candidatus Jettenia caeni]UJS17560.1 MAG: hypothetical protein L3J17_00500 [Candidatus Jettenia sp.]
MTVKNNSTKQSIPIGFRVSESTAKKLETAKWTLRMSKAQIITTALEEFFDKHGIKEEISGTSKKDPSKK